MSGFTGIATPCSLGRHVGHGDRVQTRASVCALEHLQGTQAILVCVCVCFCFCFLFLFLIETFNQLICKKHWKKQQFHVFLLQTIHFVSKSSKQVGCLDNNNNNNSKHMLQHTHMK
mmetsp:Transcript_14071/g.21370  ORF Transcript_14071/g.21370 Transcript_14071/m.21370 type:complete len:116 (+) Transcript_14071:538-885(+)